MTGITTSTLSDRLREHARSRGEHPALTGPGHLITYAQLETESRAVHAVLTGAGLRPGDRIAYIGRNDAAFANVVCGAARAGVTLVPVNWRLATAEMAYVLSHSESRWAIVGDEFVHPVRSLRDLAPRLENVLALTRDPDGNPSWAELVSTATANPGPPRHNPRSVVLQLYTSGTTGRPKGAMLDAANFAAAMPVTAACYGMNADAVALIASPLFHIAGAGSCLATLWSGGTVTMLPEATPAALLEAVETFAVTTTLLVPAVIQRLITAPEVRDSNLGSLRRIVYGAAPMPPALLRKAREVLGCELVQAYGLTETTGVVVGLPPEDHDPDGPHPERLASVGRALPGSTVQIVEPGTEIVLPDGEVGEVVVRSPQNLAGYWQDPDATAGAMTPEGAFRTGDAGCLRDGYLYLRDRIKDLIISGGENVSSVEVENAVLTHPRIAECAVVGVPHPQWGETPLAVVVCSGDDPIDPADVIQHCRENLSRFKCPTSVVVVDELPRNAAGKVLKRQLRIDHADHGRGSVSA